MSEPMTNERRKRIEAWLRAKPAVRLADTHPSPERCSDIAWECLEEIDRLKGVDSEVKCWNRLAQARELLQGVAEDLEDRGLCAEDIRTFLNEDKQ